jgi:hypothetical protein
MPGLVPPIPILTSNELDPILAAAKRKNLITAVVFGVAAFIFFVLIRKKI